MWEIKLDFETLNSPSLSIIILSSFNCLLSYFSKYCLNSSSVKNVEASEQKSRRESIVITFFFVVFSDENMQVTRQSYTMKYLLGLALGKWIVSHHCKSQRSFCL